MKHQEQVLNLLKTQIGNLAEVKDISDTAKKVANEWVNRHDPYRTPNSAMDTYAVLGSLVYWTSPA